MSNSGGTGINRITGGFKSKKAQPASQNESASQNKNTPSNIFRRITSALPNLRLNKDKDSETVRSDEQASIQQRKITDSGVTPLIASNEKHEESKYASKVGQQKPQDFSDASYKEVSEPILQQIASTDITEYEFNCDLIENLNSQIASITTGYMLSENKKLQEYGLKNLKQILENKNISSVVVNNFYTYIKKNTELQKVLARNKKLSKQINTLFKNYDKNKKIFAMHFSSNQAPEVHLNKKTSQRIIQEIINADKSLLESGASDYLTKLHEKIASVTTNLMMFSEEEYSKQGMENLEQILRDPNTSQEIMKSFYESFTNNQEMARILDSFGQLDKFKSIFITHEKIKRKKAEELNVRQKTVENIINTTKEALKNEKSKENIKQQIYGVTFELISSEDEVLKQEGIQNLRKIITDSETSFAMVKNIHNLINKHAKTSAALKKEYNDTFKKDFLEVTRRKLVSPSSLLTSMINHIVEETQKEIKKKQNQSKISGLPSNIDQFKKIFFDNYRDISQQYLKHLNRQLGELKTSGLPYALEEARDAIITSTKKHLSLLTDINSYSLFAEPWEIANFIKEQEETFITPALKAVDYNFASDNEGIKREIKSAVQGLQEKQTELTTRYNQDLTNIGEMRKNIDAELDNFDAEFDKNFGDVYEIYSIQAELESINPVGKTIIQRILSKLISIYKRIKHFFISKDEIMRTIGKSKEVGVVCDGCTSNIRELQKKLSSFEDTTQTDYLANGLAKKDENHQHLIASINAKRKQKIAFLSKKTVDLIKKTNEKLNNTQQKALADAIQDISNTIDSHQQQYEQNILNDKTSVVFRYALNKALEFVAAQAADNLDVAAELKSRFVHICHSLNISPIDLQQLGFSKDGIPIDIFKSTVYHEHPEISADTSDVADMKNSKLSFSDDIHFYDEMQKNILETERLQRDIASVSEDIKQTPIEDVEDDTTKNAFTRCIEAIRRKIGLF